MVPGTDLTKGRRLFLRLMIIMFRAFVLAIVAFASLPLHAQQAWKGEGMIEFQGSSTLHDFKGTVPVPSFELLYTSPGNEQAATVSADVSVKAGKMDTGNRKRDRKMHESMEVTEHPLVQVSVDDLKLSETGAEWKEGMPEPDSIPFTLTLLGKEQDLIAEVASWKETEKRIDFVVEFPVSLSASGIQVPSVIGVIRVGDEIQVKAALTLTLQN